MAGRISVMVLLGVPCLLRSTQGAPLPQSVPVGMVPGGIMSGGPEPAPPGDPFALYHHELLQDFKPWMCGIDHIQYTTCVKWIPDHGFYENGTYWAKCPICEEYTCPPAHCALDGNCKTYEDRYFVNRYNPDQMCLDCPECVEWHVAPAPISDPWNPDYGDYRNPWGDDPMMGPRRPFAGDYNYDYFGIDPMPAGPEPASPEKRSPDPVGQISEGLQSNEDLKNDPQGQDAGRNSFPAEKEHSAEDAAPIDSAEKGRTFTNGPSSHDTSFPPDIDASDDTSSPPEIDTSSPANVEPSLDTSSPVNVDLFHDGASTEDGDTSNVTPPISDDISSDVASHAPGKVSSSEEDDTSSSADSSSSLDVTSTADSSSSHNSPSTENSSEILSLDIPDSEQEVTLVASPLPADQSSEVDLADQLQVDHSLEVGHSPEKIDISSQLDHSSEESVATPQVHLSQEQVVMPHQANNSSREVTVTHPVEHSSEEVILSDQADHSAEDVAIVDQVDHSQEVATDDHAQVDHSQEEVAVADSDYQSLIGPETTQGYDTPLINVHSQDSQEVLPSSKDSLYTEADNTQRQDPPKTTSNPEFDIDPGFIPFIKDTIGRDQIHIDLDGSSESDKSKGHHSSQGEDRVPLPR